MDGPYYKAAKDKRDYFSSTEDDDVSSNNLGFTRHDSSDTEGLQPSSDRATEVGEAEQEREDPRTPRDRITGSEIRLLKLRPGNKDDDLVGNIELYPFRYVSRNVHKAAHENGNGHDGGLNDAHLDPRGDNAKGNHAKELPEYEALSYTWGEDKLVDSIKVLEGDKMFEIKITKNLKAALETLRYPRKTTERSPNNAQEVLRNQARYDPKAVFRRLQNIVKGEGHEAAMKELRAILPEVPESQLENFVRHDLRSGYHSPEEANAINQLNQMVWQDPHEEESPAHRYLWIDAVCIDQTDKEEKSRQSPRRSDIYMKAKEVCVWLGEEQSEAHSALAMDFVDEVLENWEDIKQIIHAGKETQWDAFMKLIRRPWFSQRWIVQELTWARQATIYCGQKWVRWEKFADVISLFKQNQVSIQDLFKRSVQLGNDPERIGDLDELSAIRLVHASEHLFRRAEGETIMEKLLPLEGLMSTLTAFEATEPKDTIYAIMWLARDATPVSSRAFTLSASGIARAQSKLEWIERASRMPSRVNSHAPTPARGPSPPPGAAAGYRALEAMAVNSDQLRLRLASEAQTQSLERAALSDAAAEPGIEVTKHMARPESRMPSPAPPNASSLGIPGMDNRVPENGEMVPPTRYPGHVPEDTLRDGSGPRAQSDAGNDLVNDAANGLANGMTADELRTNQSRAREFMTRLKGKRFLIDYEKTLFEVAYDFLRFSIERSGRLDILCRPWAPDPIKEELDDGGQLPSWVRRLSEHAIFSKHYGGPMERVNADPLVGRPGTGEKRFYSADRGIRATFKTHWVEEPQRDPGPQDWMKAQIPEADTKTVREKKRCLIVRGFVLDQIKHRHPAARSGSIPMEWLKAVKWTDPESKEPPDDFWRMLVGNRDLSGDRAPALWKRACQQVFKKRVQGGDLNIKRLLMKSSLSEPIRHFLKRVESMVFRRSLLDLTYTELFAQAERAAAEAKAAAAAEEAKATAAAALAATITVAPPPDEEPPRLQRSSLNGMTWPATPRPLVRATTAWPRPDEDASASELVQEIPRLALGPCEDEAGDIVAIIFGCSAPVVLRKVTEDTAPGAAPWSWKRTPYEYSLPRMRKDKAEEEAEEEEHSYERFQLVGECYVHGMMDGEAWKVPNIYLEIRKFTIV